MPIDKKALAEVALSEAEYEAIDALLGREPSAVELGMFGILWSEHCGYKHSKLLLRDFPSRAPWVLIGPGEENAGVVDIGDGQAVVMKIESHNHPSAIEPYQGAATGVGGIVRDVFSMGARPIALLNALFFGPPVHPRNRYLFHGVVGGIGGYGNCLGIPDVAGQVSFASSYSGNPLVNAMCVGLVKTEGIVRAGTGRPGDILLLVGSDTGRDGIHGATFASVDLSAESEQRRTAVQVGNPFMEKLLVEACLELTEQGFLVGMQDLGAGGLTSAAVECAAKAGLGVEIDVSRVPRREEGMTPYEVMLSESQERMLLIVRPGDAERAKALFDKWDLTCVEVGRITSDGLARIRDGERVVAEAPVRHLTEPPLYRTQGREDSAVRALRARDLSSLPQPSHLGETLLRLLASLNVASKEAVHRQYDHQVLDNSVVLPGQADAAVLRVKGTKKGIALTVDANGRWCYLDPYRGGALAVAEAARNLSCVGARPLAVTDCLNFGNPERPEVAYQLEQCIRGMAEACRLLGIPVISGNVSLYNESEAGSVYPTPVVGMLGLLDDIEARCTAAFVQEGDAIYLLGASTADLPVEALGASEYLETVHGMVAGAPGVDLALEDRVQRLCQQAIQQRLLRSAHDLSEGGLAVALAESAILGSVGFQGEGNMLRGRADAALFGEAPARIVVSVGPAQELTLQELAAQQGVALCRLGRVGGGRLSLPGFLDISLSEVEKTWREALAKALAGS
ncbi:MAG: phosphoribosylformylglycinamidine synthase subunit PurL [Chloroflexi bacterium]|nr:phosphoribosylformylglycinamidine synthase subunit PurL [Chloroflexota bacterium]